MKVKTNFVKAATSGLLVLSLLTITGCSNGNNDSLSSDNSSALQSTVEATQNGDVPFADAYNAIKNAKLGDTITANTYLVSVAEGVKTYYVHGRYVLVASDTNTVVQIRDEIEVPNTSLSLREIIKTDPDFDIDKATISFYSSDGTAITGTLDDTLSSTITDCVVEYADWEDEEETFGVVQSYLFTFGYVPVKITGYYQKNDDGSSDAVGGTTSSGTSSEVSSDTSGANSSESSATSNSSGEGSENGDNTVTSSSDTSASSN